MTIVLHFKHFLIFVQFFFKYGKQLHDKFENVTRYVSKPILDLVEQLRPFPFYVKNYKCQAWIISDSSLNISERNTLLS